MRPMHQIGDAAAQYLEHVTVAGIVHYVGRLDRIRCVSWVSDISLVPRCSRSADLLAVQNATATIAHRPRQPSRRSQSANSHPCRTRRNTSYTCSYRS